jgi:hypothetical protein
MQKRNNLVMYQNLKPNESAPQSYLLKAGKIVAIFLVKKLKPCK